MQTGSIYACVVHLIMDKPLFSVFLTLTGYVVVCVCVCVLLCLDGAYVWHSSYHVSMFLHMTPRSFLTNSLSPCNFSFHCLSVMSVSYAVNVGAPLVAVAGHFFYLPRNVYPFVC